MKNKSMLVCLLISLLVLPATIFAQEEKPKWELKIGGYGQIQYVVNTDTGSKTFDAQMDNLQVRRFRLTFDGKLLDEKLFWRAYFDLEKMPSARVREAYLGYDFGGLAKLKLTAGQHLVPFSVDHLQSSSKRLIAERSKVTSNLAPGRDIGGLQDRDIGISLHGKYLVDFWVGIFQGGVSISGGKFSGSELEKVDNRKDIALRAVYKDCCIKGVDVGISYYNGGLSTATVAAGKGEPIEPLPRRRTGVEILFTKGDISLQTEYMFGEDPFGADKTVLSKTRKKSGWYFQGAYKLDAVLQGLQVASRYGSWDPDTDKADNEETQLTIASVYDLSKHARLLFDYTRNTERPTDLDNDTITLRYQIKF